MTTQNTSEVNHAISNAKGGLETIREQVAALTLEGAAELFAATKTWEECVTLLAEHYGKEDELPKTLAQSMGADVDEARQELAEAIVNGFEPAGFEYDESQAQETIQEGPLSVEVRSGWYTPGSEPEPEEFCILLSTGGPALRIRGELGQYNEPERAWLEYQDWGTPWTQYFDADQETLLTYARQFYFGE